MYKITVGVEGMACQMCEAHVGESFRKACPQITSAKSSHKKRTCVMTSTDPIPEQTLRDALAPTGYGFLSYRCEEVTEDKGFFARLTNLFS